MLKVVRSMSELPFEQLMEVYHESNIRCAQRHWGEYSTEYGLEMVRRMAYEELQCGFFSIPDAAVCLWMWEGECVSALRLEPWEDGWLLTALETAPACRKKGYAQALLAAVQANLAQSGPVRLYSHIHRHNAASIRLHRQCGFRQIADTAQLLDGTVTTQMGTYLFDVQ